MHFANNYKQWNSELLFVIEYYYSVVLLLLLQPRIWWMEWTHSLNFQFLYQFNKCYREELNRWVVKTPLWSWWHCQTSEKSVTPTICLQIFKSDRVRFVNAKTVSVPPTELRTENLTSVRGDSFSIWPVEVAAQQSLCRRERMDVSERSRMTKLQRVWRAGAEHGRLGESVDGINPASLPASTRWQTT